MTAPSLPTLGQYSSPTQAEANKMHMKGAWNNTAEEQAQEYYTNYYAAQNANTQMQNELLLSQYNNEMDIYKWQLQNEYNSPAAQRARLLAGGFNPAFMNAQAGNAGQISSSNVSTTSTPSLRNAPHISASDQINGVLSSLINLKRSILESKKLSLAIEQFDERTAIQKALMRNTLLSGEASRRSSEIRDDINMISRYILGETAEASIQHKNIQPLIAANSLDKQEWDKSQRGSIRSFEELISQTLQAAAKTYGFDNVQDFIQSTINEFHDNGGLRRQSNNGFSMSDLIPAFKLIDMLSY